MQRYHFANYSDLLGFLILNNEVNFTNLMSGSRWLSSVKIDFQGREVSWQDS